MASTGPNKTEGTSLAGSHVRGPVHWFSIAIRKDITRPTLSNAKRRARQFVDEAECHKFQCFFQQFRKQVDADHDHQKRDRQRRHVDGVFGPRDLGCKRVGHQR